MFKTSKILFTLITAYLFQISSVFGVNTSELTCSKLLESHTEVGIEEGNESLRLLESTLAVHVSNHFPENGFIKSGLSFPEDGGLFDPNTTIHFAIGNMVAAHEYGDWENHKVGIIVPTRSVLEGAINFFAHDTAYLGDFLLPKDSVVLVPEDMEVPNASYPFQIVRYNGELRKAVESIFNQQKKSLIEMQKFSGLTGDPALIGGIDINSIDFFNALAKEFPQLSFGSAMDSLWHGEYEAVMGIIEDYQKSISINFLSPEELNLAFYSINKKLKELRNSLENFNLKESQQKEIESRIDSMELEWALLFKNYDKDAFLQSIKDNDESEWEDLHGLRYYIRNLEFLSAMNQDLSTEDFVKKLKQFNFPTKAISDLVLVHAVIKYFSRDLSLEQRQALIKVIANEAKKILNGSDKIEEGVKDVIITTQKLFQMSHVSIRNKEDVEKYEYLLNMPELRPLVEKKLKSIADDYEIEYSFPFSLKEFGEAIRSSDFFPVEMR